MASTDKAARRAKFEGAWNGIRDELLDHFKSCGMPQEAQEWYARNLDYNVPGGKLNRGMSVVDSAEILLGRKLTEEEYLQAAVLGWGVELLQAFFLVSDDLMDSSITRRGQPCWYRVPKIGFIAMNDSFMLESAIYRLLKVHFKKEPYYVDLLELFHEVTYQTEMGQLIDLITAPENEVDLNRFSLKKHSLIVIYKTAFYSFYLPVALAMLFCRIPTSYTLPSSSEPIAPYEVAKEILIPLGEYFQIQDDFLDFSGVPAQIGKVGTDIVDNKCSWCINTALAYATPEQRKILDENYGVKPTEEEKELAKRMAAGKNGEEQGYLGEAEKRVKKVFEEIGLREKYAEYEEGVYKKLNAMIDGIDEGAPGQQGVLKKQIFTSFLGKIYRRQK
ncbi:isoprenoid synthase domain-containing protein [Lentinula raphanica]|uniref:(2E,6E)-farnesyl diphosphate synthase n=1 Tax=Lentinula raphanica TaxID=153919 RepID=A0AA38P0G4_9AGAR|nr:isoprenoid synthase domain-containing protein [Lentinula raphanica]KAJ3834019.1 isoprenoid synthase domain-containing protein [Lentinula raphanica]KAJ3970413.1 isoprenoid synthase domain-containing protein [Lentinula raphanica]